MTELDVKWPHRRVFCSLVLQRKFVAMVEKSVEGQKALLSVSLFIHVYSLIKLRPPVWVSLFILACFYSCGIYPTRKIALNM